MNEFNVLSQIYAAITTAPELLAPPFIEQLLAKILPLAESSASNDTVEDAINALYRQFKEVRNKIKNKILCRANFGDTEETVLSDYRRLIDEYPDIEKLKTSLKDRIGVN